MIKIENIPKVKLNSVKNPRKKKASASGFNLRIEEEPREVQKTEGVSSVSTINSLLSLQEVQNSYDNKKEIKYGYEMIDQLKQLQLSIACGEVSERNLGLLNNMIKQTRGRFTDPVLLNILEEIELRAEVELAKFSKLM